MFEIILVILLYLVSWGFLWIIEIPQDIFGEQFIDDPKTIVAEILFAVGVPLVAGGLLVLTLLDKLLPGGIDI